MEQSLFQNIRLNGHESITADHVVTQYDIVQKEGNIFREKILERNEISKEITKISIPLKSVTLKNIPKLRDSKKPTFLLKDYGAYYYASIPLDMSFISNATSLGPHLCGQSNYPCHRLSAAADDEGGCIKVRDIHDKKIEKYDFIMKGFEVFNSKFNCFVVLTCNHFEHVKYKKRPSLARTQALKTGLAMYVWEGIETYSDIHKHTVFR